MRLLGFRLQLLLGEPPALLADFLGPSRPRLPGDDGVDAVPLRKGQDPPHGRLRQFELCPDGTEWHFSPPELHCNPLGTIVDVFSCSGAYPCHPAAGLENAKDFIL